MVSAEQLEQRQIPLKQKIIRRGLEVKLRVKYGGDPNYAGSVMIDGLPNREAALAWKEAQVRLHKLKYGSQPPRQKTTYS